MIIQSLKPSANTILGLWKIEEHESQLINGISEADLQKIDGFHQNKREEFLATRQLMRALCDEHDIPYHGIQKDEFGKPHLIDSECHISVSHAYPMVACIINKKESCGIDIEKPRPQLNRIKRKFLSPTELEKCGEDLEMLCLHWCAKEALYKIYGKKQLIFAEELFVRNVGKESLECEVITDDYEQNHQLKYFNNEDYLIVMSV